jgi:hypothetical protein
MMHPAWKKPILRGTLTGKVMTPDFNQFVFMLKIED